MRSGAGAFFDEFAATFDTFYDSKRSRFMRWIDQHFRRDMFVRMELTFDFLRDLKGKTLLDIGCGSGIYMEMALKRGASHVTGIDPAEGMLRLARERVTSLGLTNRASFVAGYFPQQCPPGPLDYAIVMGVLDYVADPLSFLQALRKRISAGAAVSFPSTHWLRTPLRRIRYRLRKCPVYFYTEAQIRDLVRTAGFEKYRLTKIDGAGLDYVACLEA
jgi:2-polyprenyl-3-methyl-5-hydroxy-6-metoxy-1,4-benzoquinol methylase